MAAHRSIIFTIALSLLLIYLLSANTLQSEAKKSGERDLYKILGVSQDATDQQIKRAFRKLSLKYHPDKNKDNEKAQKMFMDVNYAHEVLSDPDKRQTYDLHGEEGLKKDKEAAQRGGGGIFDFFGGGGHGGKRKGPDYRMEFQVTLEDLYNGQNRVVKIARRVLCKSCKGSGAKGGATTTCNVCRGSGQVMTLQSLGPGFNIQMQTPCEKCQGKGKIAKHVCPICGGSRLQMEEKELDVIIERGMKDGQEIVFERASEQSPDTIPGDVIVTLKQQKHHRFTRKGDDLHMELTITLREALLGYSTSIAHLDGRRVQITQEGVTPPEYVKVIKGEGMPQHEFQSEKGDLYVKFHIAFPKNLTPDQQASIRALFPSQ